MRTLKDQLKSLARCRHEGASEDEVKRRAVKPGSIEWLNLERPGSLVRILGYISLSSGQLKRGYR